MTINGRKVRELRESKKLTQKALAKLVGVAQPTITDIETGKSKKSDYTAEIAAALGVAPGVLDQDLTMMAPNASPPVSLITASGRKIPVYGAAAGGHEGRFEMNGHVVDLVDAPAALDNVPDTYAVYVAGESMEPRFFAGETVFIHPYKPVRKGDFVVVQIRGEAGDLHGFVKRYVARTPSRLVLSQYNPEKEIEFDLGDVVSVHKIVGSATD